MPHFLENGSTMPAIDTAPAGKTLQPLHTRPFGKVPRFTVKAVHFPGGNAKGLPPGRPVPRLHKPARGGKCPDSGGKRFTFPEGMPKDCRLEACAPVAQTRQEGEKGLDGRETLLRTLWRTWCGNSPSEGGTILQENGYLKSMSKRPTHSPWAPAWTTTTSRPMRFL